MGSGDLSFLDPQQQALVRQMLSAVVDHPDKHLNRVMIRPHPDGSFEYFVGQRGGTSAFPQYQRLPVNIITPLIGHGWMEAIRDPTMSGSYRFTEHALEWHHANSGPSEDEIRRRIGGYLYGQFKRHPGEPQPFDVRAIAEQLDVSKEDLIAQGWVLKAAGYVATLGTVRAFSSREGMVSDQEPDPPLHFLHLTQPQGVTWAASGFPPIGEAAAPHVTVNLDLHVQVQAVINQARQAEIPKELLERFELLMRRVEEEFAKPEGRYEPVKGAIETAAASKELMGPLVGFLARNWDRIQGLADAAGDAVGNLV